VIPLFLGCLLTVGALVALAHGVWMAWVATSSRGWPTAPGQILEARVESRRIAPADLGVPEKHRAAVRYRYTVHGEDFEGTRVSFGDFIWTQFRLSAARLVAELDPGAVVAVYYDPSQPKRAVLRPGINLSLAVVPTVALLPLIVGLLLLAE
jgi:hypothetical protein